MTYYRIQKITLLFVVFLSVGITSALAEDDEELSEIPVAWRRFSRWMNTLCVEESSLQQWSADAPYVICRVEDSDIFYMTDSERREVWTYKELVFTWSGRVSDEGRVEEVTIQVKPSLYGGDVKMKHVDEVVLCAVLCATENPSMDEVRDAKLGVEYDLLMRVREKKNERQAAPETPRTYSAELIYDDRPVVVSVEIHPEQRALFTIQFPSDVSAQRIADLQLNAACNRMLYDAYQEIKLMKKCAQYLSESPDMADEERQAVAAQMLDSVGALYEMDFSKYTKTERYAEFLNTSLHGIEEKIRAVIDGVSEAGAPVDEAALKGVLAFCGRAKSPSLIHS